MDIHAVIVKNVVTLEIVVIALVYVMIAMWQVTQHQSLIVELDRCINIMKEGAVGVVSQLHTLEPVVWGVCFHVGLIL